MNTLNQILRGVLFLVLAIFGMAMAFIFMISTAIAVAILYVVARIKGRPFGVKAYWEERHQPNRAKNVFKNKDVSDIEMRSEEHTSELQSLMRISYAVFCLKKKKQTDKNKTKIN